MKDYSIVSNNEQAQMGTYLEVLQSLSENTDDYLFLLELESGRRWFFKDMEKKFNLRNSGKGYYTTEEWEKVIHPKDVPVLREKLKMIAEKKRTNYNIEYRLWDREGNYIWASCKGKVKEAEEGQSRFVIGNISDTALLHKIDRLTELFNMRKMLEDMERIIAAGRNGFLLLLGIDNFKSINIKNGRESGNRTLKFMAHVLEENSALQQVYRVDGDRFAICMKKAEQEDVKAVYQKIQETVSAYFTLSGGAVEFSSASEKKVGNLYQYAEYAMDRAKKAGKNRLEFFAAGDYEKEISSIELLDELKESVQNDCAGFSLMYQPQVKSGNYRLFGAEVLLRYDSPARGPVMPNEFVPLLEQTGLICTVGLWVMKTALKQCREWREKIPEFHISINISYVQLIQDNIVKDVMDVLEKSGVPGEALTLEMTESMQLQNFQYYNSIFSEWKESGIQISVDDFGTGYSSLGYLKHLKIDEVKIDRCFVRGIQNSSYNYRLLCNMMEFVAGTQIRVCCEGVEEKEELWVLEELKPDLLQGYLFAKPCSKEQFESLYFGSEKQEYIEHQKPFAQAQGKYFGKVLNLRHCDILRETNLGLWVIRMDGKNAVNEMYADETMSRIMGADRNLSPEECYRFWHDRIRGDCYDYVHRSVDKMIQGDKVVQIQYVWVHPELGEIEVYCTGVRIEDMDGMICLEGYHRIVSNIEMTWFWDYE